MGPSSKAVESPSLEIFQTHLDKVLCSLLWVTLLVGLEDPQRSLPTPTINILWVPWLRGPRSEGRRGSCRRLSAHFVINSSARLAGIRALF